MHVCILLCMHVCMYTTSFIRKLVPKTRKYIYIYVYIYIYTYIHTHTHVCLNHKSIFSDVCVCIQKHTMHVYILCVHAHACVCQEFQVPFFRCCAYIHVVCTYTVYSNTYIHTRTHAHTYIQMYT